MKTYASAFLTEPTSAVRESFLAAHAEAEAIGQPGYPAGGLRFREFLPLAQGWHTQDGFERFVTWLRGQKNLPMSDGLVPTTDLWLVTPDDEYLGRISVRHALNRRLMADGGNIGYDIRPSARRQGLATFMLGEALPWAARLGIDPALVTVLEENAASRAVIEKNGGIRDDGTHAPEVSAVPTHLLRYWLPTTPGRRGGGGGRRGPGS